MPKQFALIALALASSPALAQQSAHLHGFAEINLAVDGDELQIEFFSPAESIVGFEYEASTAAERKAVADAIALLKNPDRLFELPDGAGCELREVEAERQVEDDDEHDHGEHARHDDEHAQHDDTHSKHDYEHAGHDDGHRKHDDEPAENAAQGDREHDDHDDEHAHEDSDGAAGHSEFHAYYHFDCGGPPIRALELRLFDTWPRIEAVRVQALTPAGQFGGNIDASDPLIRLQ